MTTHDDIIIIEANASDINLQVLKRNSAFYFEAYQNKERFIIREHATLREAIDALALFLQDEYALSIYS